MNFTVFAILLLSSTAAMAAETMDSIAGKIASLLTGVSGIQVTSVGESVVVSGEVASRKEMASVVRVADGVRSVPIHNLVVLSEAGCRRMADEIEQTIGAKEIQIKLLNNVILIQGTAANDYEADRAVEIAKTFIFAPIGPSRSPASNKEAGGDSLPVQYNRNNLPTTVVDMLRVAPRPGGAILPKRKR